MASALRSLRRRIARMEKQGFIVPQWMKAIKKEETALKYSSRKAIAEKSKFREIYRGKERVVSGKRGLEVLQKISAQKRKETIERKKRVDRSGGWTWGQQMAAFDLIINNYFSHFISETLADMFREAYEEAKEADRFFVIGLLEEKSDVIENLQRSMTILPSGEDEEADRAYTDWQMIIGRGLVNSDQFRRDVAQAEDEASGGYTIV